MNYEPTDEELEAMKPTLEALYRPLRLPQASYWDDEPMSGHYGVDDCNCTFQAHCPDLFRCKRPDPYDWKRAFRRMRYLKKNL